MNVDKVIFPGLTNGTRLYSPITLSKEWSTLGRLVAMVFAAMFGAVMNVYFISSFTVQVSLRKKGYIYYCCLGLADVLVTCCVIPMSAVVLLSGVWDIYPVCQVLQTLTAASTYSYSILSTMVAAENYLTVKGYGSDCTCNKYLIGASAFLVFPFSLALAIYGTYWHQDYDYCGRRYHGDPLFRHATTILIHGTCGILTMTALIISNNIIRRENRLPPVYRELSQFSGDLPNLVRVNMIAYILYAASWLPYIIVINFYPDISDSVYYQCAWLGIGRSLISSLLYGTLTKTFAGAYANLFFYCCCKISLYSSYRSPRSRRLMEYYNAARAPIAPEVRTHIMQQAVNPNSPQRASSSTRETLEL